MVNGGAVILLAYYYPPENTSGVQRAVRIAKYLPCYGHKCYVVCSSHKGEDSSIQDVFHVPSSATQTPGADRFAKLAAWTQRIFFPYNEQLPWVPHALAASRAILTRDSVQAVISTSPPVAGHLAALRLKQRYGLKWLADFRDPILGNPNRSRRWARPYDAFLERFLLRYADIVTTVTDASAAELCRKYPWAAGKIQVVWNGYDPEEAFGPLPIPVRPYRLLSHIGVLYALRHPNALMGSLARLIRNGALDSGAFKLRFVGPLEAPNTFVQNPAVSALREHGCIEIQGELVPRSDAMREIATADCLLLIDIVNLSGAGYTVPAKLYDYIRAGRPILAITHPNSPVERILAGCGLPYVCLYHHDPDALVDQKLLGFLRLPSRPVSPSDWFVEQFDGRRQAGKIAALLNAQSSQPAFEAG